MIFPHKDEVLSIQRRLIDEFGGGHGMRDEGLLDSAMLAPAQRQHYEAATLSVCAATYAFHLTRNHPFVDGNKRIGAAIAELFVLLNGGRVTATNDEIVDVFMGVAAGTLSRDDVERVFERWVEPPAG